MFNFDVEKCTNGVLIFFWKIEKEKKRILDSYIVEDKFNKFKKNKDDHVVSHFKQGCVKNYFFLIFLVFLLLFYNECLWRVFISWIPGKTIIVIKSMRNSEIWNEKQS